MIIVAGMSIQDPRERPVEERDKAEALHRRFWAPLPGAEEGTEDEECPPDRSPGQDRPESRSARSRRQRLPGLPAALGLPSPSAEIPVRQRVPAEVPAASSCTSCGSGSGRTCTPSCKRHARDLEAVRATRRPHRSTGCTPPSSPGCCPRSAWPTSRRSRPRASGTRRTRRPCGSTSGPAARGSRSTRARRWPGPSRRW